jgi:hypothetical protein
MQPARVDVELGFFPLMWILYLCTPPQLPAATALPPN